MLLETVVGGLGGGLLRLAPEVIKLLDRKAERAHELALGSQQFELVKLQGHNQLQLAERTEETRQLVTALEALRDGIKTQGTQVGIKFVDAMSALVRPAVTYTVMGMWVAYKAALYVAAYTAGNEWFNAVLQSWGANDWAMLAGILNFWFLGRVFDKRT